MNTASKLYLREFAISMSAYVIVIIGSVSLIKVMPESSVLRVPIAISPVVPICFVLLAFLRYLSRIDELQQRIQLQAIGFAAGAISMLSFAYGLLENVGLPPLSVVYVFPATILLWGLAVSSLSHKYA